MPQCVHMVSAYLSTCAGIMYFANFFSCGRSQHSTQQSGVLVKHGLELARCRRNAFIPLGAARLQGTVPETGSLQSVLPAWVSMRDMAYKRYECQCICVVVHGPVLAKYAFVSAHDNATPSVSRVRRSQLYLAQHTCTTTACAEHPTLTPLQHQTYLAS